MNRRHLDILDMPNGREQALACSLTGADFQRTA
jgi:hypothetical protein